MYVRKNDVKKLASVFFYQLEWVLFFLQVQALFAHWFLLHGLVDCLSLYFCSCSVTESCPSLAIPWTVACQTSKSFIFSQSLLKFMSIESAMLSNRLILCIPLLLLPSVFPSIRVFSSESVLHIRWPKYGVSASTSVLPMNTQKRSPLGWTGWISLQSKRLSRVFSNTTVQKHQFFGAQLSSQSKSHIQARPRVKP